jgi:hypothetical protein
MSAAPAPVSDMTVTVKAREIQRAMLAEMRGDQSRASQHFLAAAHLEYVLADDYEQAGQTDMSFPEPNQRSLMSLASWKAGTGPANLRWPCPESSFAGIGDSRDQRRTGARLSKEGVVKGWLVTNGKCIVRVL